MNDLKNRLEESHKDLYQWFLLHQECLLIQQDEAAAKAFEAFADCLCDHIDFENRYILANQAFSGQLRWQQTVYLKEHEKLEKMLLRLQQLLADYYRLQGREKRLALLDVLDQEQSMRHVMEHHEQREEQDLFLHIAVLDMAVQDKWLGIESLLHQRHDQLRQHLKQMLATA